MSYRELTMIDVKEVLRRWQAGQSARRIAREDVAGRATAGRYIEAAQQLGLTQQSELTEEVVRQVAERVQARPAPAASEARQELVRHHDRIEAWLRADLTLVRVHELLGRDGVDGAVHDAAALRARRAWVAGARADACASTTRRRARRRRSTSV